MSIGSLYENYNPLIDYYKLLSQNPKQEFTQKELVDYFVNGKKKALLKAKGRPSQDAKATAAKAESSKMKKLG